MRFRTNRPGIFMILLAMLLFVVATLGPAWAQRQVIASQMVGAGGQTIKGGWWKVQTAAGANVATCSPAGLMWLSGTLSLDGGATALGVPTVTTAVGKALGIASGAGNGGTTTGYAGGAFSIASGAGSAGTTTGGAGGLLSITGGTGGTTATGMGGAGSAIALTSGAGGAASGAGTGGAGGAFTLAGGDGGATSGGTGGAGGAVNIYTGNAAGSAADGAFAVKLGGSSGTTVISADATGLAMPMLATVSDATATRVCTSADYGKIIFLSYAGAVAVTLPANGAPAGATIRFIVVGDNNCAPTISTATADTLITFNDAAADSVTYGTGHRIGACVLLISNGTYWAALNQSANNTMTINT